MWGRGDRGPDGAPGWRQACSLLTQYLSLPPPLSLSLSLSLPHSSLPSLFPSPASLRVEWILLHLHPGQWLLLGINKSWGFLLSQLSGGGTWKEGLEE